MKYPTSPMLPSEVPEQRLVPVVELPCRPPSFVIFLDSLTPLEPFWCPHGMPPSSEYLCLLEWAASPFSYGQTAFYLSTNRCRRHWLLWRWEFDENWGTWAIALGAYGLRRGTGSRTATLHLLRAQLEYMRCTERRGHFDWISEVGDLSAAEILAVSRTVWS